MKSILLSKTASGANNDPLVLYVVALLILGALISWPSIIKFIRTKLIKARRTNENGN